MEPHPVVVDRDLQNLADLLERYRYARGLRVLAYIVQRFANRLNDIDGNLRRRGEGPLPAGKCHRNAALLLKLIEQPARGGGDARAIDIQRAHSPNIGAY